MTDALPCRAHRSALPARRVRRRALLAALLPAPFWTPTSAGAQPASGVAFALPTPCRAGADVGSLVLEGSGAPAGSVVVFGQAFQLGAVPRGAALGARRVRGAALPVQVDVKTRHPDGSVRFAVVSLAAPFLRAGERAAVVLSVAANEPAAPALDTAASLASRRAVVVLQGDGGAPAWEVDLMPRWHAALGDAAAVWQKGPLAVEARVAVPVPPAAVGGIASARLVADVSLRADGTFWLSLWIRNDGAMQAAGGPITCGIKAMLDGQEVLRRPSGKLFQYTAWGRRAGVAQGGGPAPARPWVRHDFSQFVEAGALPRFDQSTGVAEDVLKRMASAMAAPAWNAPGEAREVERYLPSTGGRPDIGVVTGWQAAWLLSGDRRAGEFVLGQAEVAGAPPWHMWDAAHGTWLNVRNYPKLWTDARGGTGRPGDPNAGGLTQQMEVWDFASRGRQGIGWEIETAHQPDLSFLPYVLTGERWILDNLQAQSAWSIMATAPILRQSGQGLLVTPDPYNHPRAMAWSMRQVENALWASPDGSAEKAYFRNISETNWSFLVSKIPEWTAAQGEAYGWLPTGILDKGEISPWQQDFFVCIAGLAAGRGSRNARTFLGWQANWVVGRFTHADQGMNPRDGIAYRMVTVDPATKRPLSTWGEIGRATVQGGFSNRNTWETSVGYGVIGLAALAAVANHGDDPAPARRAFDWLLAAAPPNTRPSDLAANPGLNGVPAGFAHQPGHALRCTPAGST